MYTSVIQQSNSLALNVYFEGRPLSQADHCLLLVFAFITEVTAINYANHTYVDTS